VCLYRYKTDHKLVDLLCAWKVLWSKLIKCLNEKNVYTVRRFVRVNDYFISSAGVIQIILYYRVKIGYLVTLAGIHHYNNNDKTYINALRCMIYTYNVKFVFRFLVVAHTMIILYYIIIRILLMILFFFSQPRA